MNAANLSESELVVALWALSGEWRIRLSDLLTRWDHLGATSDAAQMSAREQFGLLLHLERLEVLGWHEEALK
jgi:hypothetical protein